MIRCSFFAFLISLLLYLRNNKNWDTFTYGFAQLSKHSSCFLQGFTNFQSKIRNYHEYSDQSKQLLFVCLFICFCLSLKQFWLVTLGLEIRKCMWWVSHSIICKSSNVAILQPKFLAYNGSNIFSYRGFLIFTTFFFHFPTFSWKCSWMKSIMLCQKWYFVTKIVLTYCEKKLFYSSRKLLKFEAEGREFAKFLRSLEQFIHTVKGQNNFW